MSQLPKSSPSHLAVLPAFAPGSPLPAPPPPPPPLQVGNPQSILLNGNGFYQDCAINSITSTTPPACNVTALWVPPSRSALNPFASSVNPGCAHANFTVDEGKTYLFRISNSASLTYLTVCFGGHNVTVVAADARPVEPFSVECVDVNAGQRWEGAGRAAFGSGQHAQQLNWQPPATSAVA